MGFTFRGYRSNPVVNEHVASDEKARLIKFNAATLKQCGQLENAHQLDCSAIRGLIVEQMLRALED